MRFSSKFNMGEAVYYIDERTTGNIIARPIIAISIVAHMDKVTSFDYVVDNDGQEEILSESEVFRGYREAKKHRGF